jgi:hypothetical protein
VNFTEILTDTRRLTKTNTTSYPTSEITASANRALERITALIREAEGRWQWDDSNETDFAIATTSLVADQQDYSLDGTSHFRIERVEVKDEDGAWYKLKSIDQADIYDEALTSFLSTAGIPQYYDKVGNSLFLYPKPSYSQASSLKLFYERGPDYFLTSDTTKTPGFNPLYHRLVPLWAAYDYSFMNGVSNAADLLGQVSSMEDMLTEYYARRDKDEHITLIPRVRNYR